MPGSRDSDTSGSPATEWRADSKRETKDEAFSLGVSIVVPEEDDSNSSLLSGELKVTIGDKTGASKVPRVNISWNQLESADNLYSNDNCDAGSGATNFTQKYTFNVDINDLESIQCTNSTLSGQNMVQFMRKDGSASPCFCFAERFEDFVKFMERYATLSRSAQQALVLTFARTTPLLQLPEPRRDNSTSPIGLPVDNDLEFLDCVKSFITNCKVPSEVSGEVADAMVIFLKKNSNAILEFLIKHGIADKKKCTADDFGNFAMSLFHEFSADGLQNNSRKFILMSVCALVVWLQSQKVRHDTYIQKLLSTLFMEFSNASFDVDEDLIFDKCVLELRDSGTTTELSTEGISTTEAAAPPTPPIEVDEEIDSSDDEDSDETDRVETFLRRFLEFLSYRDSKGCSREVDDKMVRNIRAILQYKAEEIGTIAKSFQFDDATSFANFELFVKELRKSSLLFAVSVCAQIAFHLHGELSAVPWMRAILWSRLASWLRSILRQDTYHWWSMLVREARTGLGSAGGMSILADVVDPDCLPKDPPRGSDNLSDEARQHAIVQMNRRIQLAQFQRFSEFYERSLKQNVRLVYKRLRLRAMSCSDLSSLDMSKPLRAKRRRSSSVSRGILINRTSALDDEMRSMLMQLRSALDIDTQDPKEILRNVVSLATKEHRKDILTAPPTASQPATVASPMSVSNVVIGSIVALCLAAFVAYISKP